MKALLNILFVAIVIGDCIFLKGGVFKGSYRTVIGVNDDGTFDLTDRDWTIRHVRGSYIKAADKKECK